MAPSAEVQVEDLPYEIRHAEAEQPKAAAEPEPGVSPVVDLTWSEKLAGVVEARLTAGDTAIWQPLIDEFERAVIRTALAVTHGRRIDAAQKLGLGRNTITRKIQELGIDG